jgi:HEAT repeat protein
VAKAVVDSPTKGVHAMSYKQRSWEVRAQELTEEARHDPRSTQELIREALAADDADEAGSVWFECVHLLRYRATEVVFDAAEQLCRSKRSKARTLGADILNQLGHPERTFPNESLQVLAGMLEGEADSGVLQSVLFALGSLDLPGAIDAILSARRHVDFLVRYAVVSALTGKEDQRAVNALIELSTDADELVRDWATFGLGTQLDLDIPPIREALVARLEDPDPVTRAEAFVGLARRKDRRVIPSLLEALHPERIDWFDPRPDLVIEAAEELHDPRLRAALRRLRASSQDE